jgi:hypothetical protein
MTLRLDSHRQFRQTKRRGFRQNFIDTLDDPLIEFDERRHPVADVPPHRQSSAWARIQSRILASGLRQVAAT